MGEQKEGVIKGGLVNSSSNKWQIRVQKSWELALVG